MSFTLDFVLKQLLLLLFYIVYLSDTVYNQKVMLLKCRISKHWDLQSHNVDLFTIKLKSFILDKECKKRFKEIEKEREKEKRDLLFNIIITNDRNMFLYS